MEWASFSCLVYFLGLQQLPNCILCTFNTSESSFNVKFLLMFLPWRHYWFLSSQSFSSFIITSLFLSSSDCMPRVSRMVGIHSVNIPTASYYGNEPPKPRWKFTLSVDFPGEGNGIQVVPIICRETFQVILIWITARERLPMSGWGSTADVSSSLLTIHVCLVTLSLAVLTASHHLPLLSRASSFALEM